MNMAKKQPIKLGIVGMGNRGANGWIRTCQLVRDCRVTALCDKIEDLLQYGYGRANDADVKCYTDYDKMLKEADIDAVAVVVEPENNVELSCRALEAGKHVLCEVPLCFSLEDCWKTVLAVEKSGLKFSMAEQVRYSPYMRAWKKMVDQDQLGKIVFVEGQYLHGMTDDRFYHDTKTGARVPYQIARKNLKGVYKSRFWQMKHPILYLPHELSPILMVLDDRVEKVTCMSPRQQSYLHDWLPNPDLQVALMHTAKDTILRLACCFTVHNTQPWHWYHFMGTKGRVETNRYNHERMKMWLADSHMVEPAELVWQYGMYDALPEALASGHGGGDYYPVSGFIECILNDTEPPMDVYKAAETAAPAVVAVQSAEQGSIPIDVPDFRPGKKRKPGCRPRGN